MFENIEFGGLIARSHGLQVNHGRATDKAFESSAIIAELNGRGAEIYKWRHLTENFFCKLKEFKRIAIGADKTDRSFAAMLSPCSAVINSR